MEMEDPSLHSSGPLTLGLAQIYGSNAQALRNKSGEDSC